MTKVDYAEKQADELMEFYLEDRRVLSRETQATFTFIAAAFSATFGYFLNLVDTRKHWSDQNWFWIFPALTLLVYLAIWAAYLVTQALTIKDIPAKGNLPSNILHSDNEPYDVEAIRAVALKGYEERIVAMRTQNLCVARCLNRTRRALLWSPLIWAVVAAAEAVLA